MAFPFKNKQKEKQEQEQEQVIQLEPLEQASFEFLQQLNQQYSDNCTSIGDKRRELNMLEQETQNIYIQATNMKAQLEAQFEKKYGKFQQGPDGTLLKV